MGNPCSSYDCMTPMVSGLRSLSLSDALSCTHGLGGFELGHFPTGMVTSSKVRTEAGRGSKEKLPTQQSRGSPGPRGEERTCHRLVFLVVWEPAVIFLPPYSTKPGQTATPTQPNTSSQTFFCRNATESAPFCLMQLDISISL